VGFVLSPLPNHSYTYYSQNCTASERELPAILNS